MNVIKNVPYEYGLTRFTGILKTKKYYECLLFNLKSWVKYPTSGKGRDVAEKLDEVGPPLSPPQREEISKMMEEMEELQNIIHKKAAY